METNFKTTLLENIENEINELGKKVAKTRQFKDSPTEYKNLIQAYKEIVELYYKIKDDLKDDLKDSTKFNIFQVENKISYVDKIITLTKECPDFVMIAETTDDVLTLEFNKQLTVNNHLLLYNGLPQQVYLDYDICDNKVSFYRNHSIVSGDYIRIVWLNN